MALEPEIGLVGRDDITALVESLVERRGNTSRRHPLPVIVAFGPGGSGKTSLLDHVRRRYREAPIAKVDLDRAGSRSCKDILDVAAEQLRSYRHAEFGRLRLPRYELARLALHGEQAQNTDTDPHHRARELAAKQMTRLVAVADAAEVVEVLPPAQGLGKVLRPLLLWLIGLAVVAPRPLRWLLGGPRVASALRWFENYVGQEAKAGQHIKFDDALVHMWNLHRSGDTLEIDRLLVAAFLADIAAAYRFRGYRRLNSLLLLDGADLLDGMDSYLPPKRPRPAARATDFLSLLAERRLEQPDVPLLVIATKQAAPTLPDIKPDYPDWRERHEREKTAQSVFLPVRLEPFTPAQTRQFLAEWNRTRDSTVESEALVEELHEVTHGHPLAVRLAIQLVQFVFARDQVLPSVRAVFDERLPVDETTTFQDATVGDYLLLRFFQRIPGADEVPEREAAREIFARLAAPRVLDKHVVRALLPPTWSAENMRALLAQLSFVTRQDDNFVLHPLLRDLLARRLREVPENDPFSHVGVHRLLKERFDSLGQRKDALYHALALADVHLVAHRLRPLVDERNDGWIAELAAIAEAPMPPGEGEEHQEDQPRAWWQRLRAPGARRTLHRRVDSVVRPETGLLEDAVIATWELRSRSRIARPNVEMYDRVLRAHQDLNGPEERLTAYRATKRALENNTPASPPAPLPRSSAVGRHHFAWRWPSRNALRRTAVYLIVALLVLYGAAFYVQSNGNCLRYGIYEPSELVADLAGHRTRLSKVDGVQCVGMSEKPGRFAYGDPTLQNSDDAEVEELAKLIAAENARVDSAKDRTAVEIVVATMLSSRERVKRDLSAGVNELRGAYLAQREWNQLDGIGRNPLVRIVLANFGGESEHAEKVAEQIKSYAERDRDVLAVTGLGQSRASTTAALEALAPAPGSAVGVPMVGSALSSTRFSRKPYFFRIAPANDRQAEVMARIIERTPALRDRPLHLVQSPGDEYSSDLANELRERLTSTLHGYDEGMTVATQLGRVVREICRMHRNPLILYTGRTAEIGGLLTELNGSACTDPVVFGGDDLTQLETSSFADLEGIKQYADGRLYFTTFAWTPSMPGIPQATQQFFTLYEAAQERHAKKAFLSGPNGHILLAYDAVTVVARAASRGAAREAVFQSLRTLRDFQGASGRLTFARDGASGTSGSDPDDKLVVGQIVKLDNGKLVSRYVMHEGA